MRAAGHAVIPPLNNPPAHGRRALREFSSGHSVPSMIYQAYRTQAAYLDRKTQFTRSIGLLSPGIYPSQRPGRARLEYARCIP
jgi:hypothetical protein